MLLGIVILITIFFSHLSFLLISFFFCSRLAMLQEKALVPSPQWQPHPPSKRLQPTKVLQGSWHLRDWRLIELSTPSLSNSCTCELSVCDLNVSVSYLWTQYLWASYLWTQYLWAICELSTQYLWAICDLNASKILLHIVIHGSCGLAECQNIAR